jgi:hypothetical protein
MRRRGHVVLCGVVSHSQSQHLHNACIRQGMHCLFAAHAVFPCSCSFQHLLCNLDTALTMAADVDCVCAFEIDSMYWRQFLIMPMAGPCTGASFSSCTGASFSSCPWLASRQVLHTVGLCTLDALLADGPLDELSAMFVAASVVLGLEHLHWSHIMYRYGWAWRPRGKETWREY